MTTAPHVEATPGDPPLARFGTADLQVHTSYGDGMADAQELFDRIDGLTGLDVVAVTDHDDIGGALLAREVHARGNYSFEFVTGIELTTRAGHLLALWVDEHHRWLQVFTPPAVDGVRPGLAIEPMTAPADAFNSGTDLVTLAPAGGPGDELSVSWGIHELA